MLVMAATTNCEMSASRRDTLRGWLQDFHHLSPGKTRLLFDQLEADHLSRDGKRDENRPAIRQPADGVPSINKTIYPELESIIHGLSLSTETSHSGTSLIVLLALLSLHDFIDTTQQVLQIIYLDFCYVCD